MAGGTKRRKARPSSRPAARPRRPALGNDPFEKGAAVRLAVATPTPTSTPTPSPTASPSSTPTSSPAPTPNSPAAAAATPTRSSPLSAVAATSAKLADAERRLDAALDGIEARVEELAARAGVASAPREARDALARLFPVVKEKLAAALELVRLVEPPERLDRHGMDPRFAERLEPVIELLYSSWWRVQVRDAGRVPSAGPVMVVANHAGAVPWDAVVLRHALRRDHPARRDLRPLLDDRECDLPVIGPALVRHGAVRASAEAAERLLADGGAIGVFPEGSAVARKAWRDRYRIQRFGRGGFVKVALRARAPIVPCAIVGSEEASPGLARTGWLAERLGVPLLSANPSLRVEPAALLPLPSRWTLRFGDPIDVSGHPREAAEDAAVVNELAERVRSTLQAMLDEGVAARGSIFL